MESEEPLEPKQRKVYTREYKVEAVRLATENGKSLAQVAKDLGINKNTLWNWSRELRRDQQNAFPGKGRMKPIEEENRRLRRENQVLRQERDFLKKAAVWLAQEAHPSTD
jgi:transposase